MSRRFRQVDVFSDRLGYGNPLAVVADADGLDDETMARIARWTNLSETTFLLPPTDPRADYRVRIFTPGGELPFAGHPTLGTCHTWLALGGHARGDRIVQECGVGLVSLRRDAGMLAFAAPPLRRSEVAADVLAATIAALGIEYHQVLRSQVLDNGPTWLTLQLDSAATVLSVDSGGLSSIPHFIGLVGIHEPGAGADIEVRGLTSPDGIPEDPVTGSLNASIAQWLVTEGVLPSSYTAAQGTALGREGRVRISVDADGTWVGGYVAAGVKGTIAL
jgi:PhzF family phenazine biosynthesis protein